MKVLVDYDNIPHSIQKKGVLYLSDRITVALSASFSTDDRLELRLYGGWDQDGTLTKKATDLSVELQRDFPTVFSAVDPDRELRIVVTASLAHSLLADPGIMLTHTYRLRPPARRLTCESPDQQGCTTGTCVLVSVRPFFETGQCPASECQVSFEDLIKGHSEQKMVDTSMVTDLAFLANNSEEQIVVVTADDDIWPGMAMAMQAGSTIRHIDPRGFGPMRYAGSQHKNYVFGSL